MDLDVNLLMIIFKVIVAILVLFSVVFAFSFVYYKLLIRKLIPTGHYVEVYKSSMGIGLGNVDGRPFVMSIIHQTHRYYIPFIANVVEFDPTRIESSNVSKILSKKTDNRKMFLIVTDLGQRTVYIEKEPA